MTRFAPVFPVIRDPNNIFGKPLKEVTLRGIFRRVHSGSYALSNLDDFTDRSDFSPEIVVKISALPGRGGSF
jgi:hypothetical protein